MAEWPKVCILLLTYNRQVYAERTLRSALDNIHYSGSLSVHIADDGTGPAYRQHLFELAGGYSQVRGVGVTDAGRGGYGRNFNLATQTIHLHSQIVLPLEDDWELIRLLDLDSLVLALNDPRVGCIRLGYLGLTNAEGVFGEVCIIAGNTYLLLDPSSEEPHVFAGHPRLETVAWERAVGPWPEELEAGETEFAVCHIPEARQGIAWPMDLVHPVGDLFAHIGTVPADRLRQAVMA